MSHLAQCTAEGRPGVLLSTLVPRSKMEPVLQLMFTQTSTIGVRILPTERRKLQREQREVQTSLGAVRVKAVILDGKERLVPEYEECKRLAEAHTMPLVEVYKVLEKEIA